SGQTTPVGPDRVEFPLILSPVGCYVGGRQAVIDGKAQSVGAGQTIDREASLAFAPSKRGRPQLTQGGQESDANEHGTKRTKIRDVNLYARAGLSRILRGG